MFVGKSLAYPQTLDYIGRASQKQTLYLIQPICKLQRKQSVVNILSWMMELFSNETVSVLTGSDK
jgi:hypothetical protein